MDQKQDHDGGNVSEFELEQELGRDFDQTLTPQQENSSLLLPSHCLSGDIEMMMDADV